MSHSFHPPRFRPSYWFLGAVMALLGAAMGVLPLIHGVRAKSWAETPARMTACERVNGLPGHSHLVVRYTYAFAGQHYLGTRLGFTDGIPQGDLVKSYAPGRDVICFVNPQDPSEAMLRRAPGLGRWLLPILLATGAAGLGFGGRRALAQQRIADAATLYSLEASSIAPIPVDPPSDRRAA